MRFNSDFYKGKYFWIGILGLAFLADFPWNDVCTIQGIISLIMVVIGTVSLIGSMFNFSRYFS
ncbi:hypothetical protein ACFQAV_08125 [Companilactobacillus huachuanensis]|uniref:Uncharacterized protein n=1 Tax=Companilactobacillus huachuanensis TaxID=2559914 RepID=A0ABW1RLT4_9LACO|nr:hypothetical protein [Companilactobacillus huachuanensis]